MPMEKDEAKQANKSIAQHAQDIRYHARKAKETGADKVYRNALIDFHARLILAKAAGSTA